jgi:hypothetical protein
MKIVESKDLFGADIVTVLDEENDTAVSMLKSTYDEIIAAQSTPIVTEDE